MLRKASNAVALALSLGASIVATAVRAANDVSLPETLRGIAHTKKTRLVGVWGGYELKAAAQVLAYSSTTNRAASGGGGVALRIWDLDTGRQVKVLGEAQNWATSAAFSPDGKELVVANQEGIVTLFEAESGKPLKVFRKHQGEVSSIAFSSDGKQIASAGEDGTVRVWNKSTGRVLLLSGHIDWVRAVAFFSDGNRLASGGDDGTVRIWDLAKGRALKTIGMPGGPDVTALAITDDDRYALIGHDHGTRLYDLESSGAVRLFDKGNRAVAVGFSSDGSRAIIATTTRKDVSLFSAKSNGAVSEVRIRQWDIESGEMASECSRADDGSPAVVIGEDGARALVGTLGSVSYWDLASGVEIASTTGHTGQVEAVAVSPNGQFALTAGRDGTARLWDTSFGKALYTFGGYGRIVRGVAFSPDGTCVLIGDANGTQKLWDLVTYLEFQTLGQHRGLRAVAFVDNGRHAISVSLERIIAWEAATGKEIASTWFPRLATAVAISENGKLVINADIVDGLVVRDSVSGKIIQTLQRGTRNALAVALSKDGALAAVATSAAAGVVGGEQVELWDVPSGRLISAIKAPAGLNTLAFSGDCKLLLASGRDGAVRLLGVPGLKEVDRIDLWPNSEQPTAAVFGQEGLSLLIGTSIGAVQNYFVTEPVK